MKKVKFIEDLQTKQGLIIGRVVEDTAFENLFCNAEKERADIIVKAVNLLSFIENYIEGNKLLQWTSDKDMADFGNSIKAELLKQAEQK